MFIASVAVSITIRAETDVLNTRKPTGVVDLEAVGQAVVLNFSNLNGYNLCKECCKWKVQVYDALLQLHVCLFQCTLYTKPAKHINVQVRSLCNFACKQPRCI